MKAWFTKHVGVSTPSLVFAATLAACGGNGTSQTGTGDLAITDAYTADGTTIVVDLNKPVTGSSVASATFEVLDAGGNVVATATIQQATGQQRVTVTLGTTLEYSTEYSIRATGLLDYQGKTTTEANGTHAIRVTSVNGWAGDLTLAAAFSSDGMVVKARFSTAITESTVVPSAFTVHTADDGDGPAVSAAELESPSIAKITLAAPLTKGTVYELATEGVTDAVNGETTPAENSTATIVNTLYLDIVWHQHQPVYTDPEGDYARGPWVRKHGVKDYYDMAATIGKYPKVHCAINLTPVLLFQLQRFYLDRIGPYVNTTDKTVDVVRYFGQKSGVVSDPWVDMLLQPTPNGVEALTDEQKGWYWKDTWSAFSISDVMIGRFPEYKALRDMRDAATDGADPAYTQSELRKLKIWFELAWFDPEFLRGPVTLPDGYVVDLSDLVTEQSDGTFTADVDFGAPEAEAIAARLVVEDYEVLKNIVGVHRQLLEAGQVEVLTTPYFHPILPLVTDTDLAREAMPNDPMPANRFNHPEDAEAHVLKAKKLYQDQFGRDPTGMWPAEGSVAQAVVPMFVGNGIRWVATDTRVLQASTLADASGTKTLYSPYRVASDDSTRPGDLTVVFRDTALSDKLGFQYQGDTAEANVADFMKSLQSNAAPWGTDRLLTVILDGENAWERYAKDNDAKGTLNGIYAALEAAFDSGEIVTTSVSEYLDGDAARKVPAHPVDQLPEISHLWAGSWINANFDTWIGEYEENTAWDYLYTVREKLGEWASTPGSVLAQPDPLADPPDRTTDPNGYYAWQAWESMYAAEGSDWFWWYGDDQTADGGDAPFDREFLALLKAVYANATLADASITDTFDPPPILRVCTAPTAPISGTLDIDGVFTPDNAGDPSVANEWTEAGTGVCQDVDSGTETNPDDVIDLYYWGYSADTLYLALTFNEDVSADTGLALRLYVSQKHIIDPATQDVTQDPFLDSTRAAIAAGTGPDIQFTVGGAAREVSVPLDAATVAASVATVNGTDWGTPAVDGNIVVAGDGTLLEAAIPLASLSYQGTLDALDPLEMLITVARNDVEIDRAPNSASTVVFPDRSEMVEVTFILDATGTQLPIKTWNTGITNPDGNAFIVGNLPELGNWTPNTIPMFDDGSTDGDETAGDKIWTFRFMADKQASIQYKYTIGAEGQGWGPTEEYPLTNRGLIVTDTNADRKMVIRDVFADRPDPSGSQAELTVIEND